MIKSAKGLSFFAALALLIATSSCGGNENREVIEFDKYNYSAVAEVDTDSVALDDADDRFWQCTGSGVLPVKIGKRDITALRDTLMKIAAVDFDENKAMPRLPRGYKSIVTETDSVDSRSQVVNELSVVLITPEVMVWRNFNYAYPHGAAHGNYVNTYINYSLVDGKILTRQDIFKPDTDDQLLALLREGLSEREDLMVYPDDIEIPETFRITADGITFVYGLYAVAPYSAGEVEVPIKAYSVSDILTENAARHIFNIVEQ